tara:strand:+ start:10 stop:567 length:558 start_codon:yes stop_codon:yes gene_type:complete
MASELRVDKIIPTSGVPTGGGGGIIQVTQGNRNSRSMTTSTAYVAAGLSGTITPKINTSKVLVTVTTTATWASTAATLAAIIRRKVGGSYIANSPLGNTGHGNVNTPDGTTMAAYIGYQVPGGSDNRNNQVPMTVQWWDSPATTSEITYELWIAGNGTSGAGIGGLGDQDGYNIYSQIIMMEVSA